MKMENRTTISEMGNKIQNTFVPIANVLSGSEMGKISAAKLRDVDKLFHLGDESGITPEMSWLIWEIGKLRQIWTEKGKSRKSKNRKKRRRKN